MSSKSLNASGFLDSPLHPNEFAAKLVGWFKPKRIVTHTCIPMGKVLDWIRGKCALEHIFIKLAALQPQLTQLQSEKFYRVYFGKQSLRFLFSDILSAFRWKLQNIITLLHLSVCMHTSKWRFYKNCICRVCEQIIVRRGPVLTHKREQHSSCEGECQKKVFYRTCDVIWTLILWFLSSANFSESLTTHSHSKIKWWRSQL